MRKFVITMGILLMASGIVSLEYGFFPDRVIPLNSVSGDFERNDSSGTSDSVSQISIKNFDIANIPNITQKQSSEIRHLFGHISVTSEEDNLVVRKSDFIDEEKGTLLVSVYEIFPLRSTTVSKAFSFLHKKLEATFADTPETNINPTDDFGIHSLYLNSHFSPEKTFLLAVTDDRLIGFEYLKENHQKLLPLFTQLVPARK